MRNEKLFDRVRPAYPGILVLVIGQKYTEKFIFEALRGDPCKHMNSEEKFKGIALKLSDQIGIFDWDCL